jgi:hypothetical protein
MQRLRGAARQGHRHELVAAFGLQHADPALACRVDHPAAQGAGEAAIGAGFGEADRFGPGPLQIKAPEAAVAVVNEHRHRPPI